MAVPSTPATEGNARRKMKMCVCVSAGMEMIRSVCVCVLNGGEMRV